MDVEVVWSKKLRTTAGFCKYKGLYNARAASIELSTKVLDDFGKCVSSNTYACPLACLETLFSEPGHLRDTPIA